MIKLNENNREPNYIVFAQQKFTSLEKDLIYLVINQLPNLKKGEEWDVNRNLTVQFTLNDKKLLNKTRVKAALKSMQTKSIEVDGFENGRSYYSITSIFTFAEYNKGIVTIKVNGQVIPQLRALKDGYSVYNLKQILSLQGIHPKRLFEMFCSYINRKTKIIEIEVSEIRKYLNIEDKYTGNNSLLKQRIIEPAIKQINEKTFINASIQLKRVKKISYFLFFLERKKNFKKQEITEATFLNEMQQECFKLGRLLKFQEYQIKQILESEQMQKKLYQFYANYRVEITKGTIEKSILRGKYYNYVKTGKFE